MRAVCYFFMQCLNDWLICSAEEHYFSRETYALASYYVDVYLSRRQTISKNDLQLVGYTALFLASKMEESHTLRTLPYHLSK
jgi:cyclin E